MATDADKVKNQCNLRRNRGSETRAVNSRYIFSQNFLKAKPDLNRFFMSLDIHGCYNFCSTRTLSRRIRSLVILTAQSTPRIKSVGLKKLKIKNGEKPQVSCRIWTQLFFIIDIFPRKKNNRCLTVLFLQTRRESHIYTFTQLFNMNMRKVFIMCRDSRHIFISRLNMKFDSDSAHQSGTSAVYDHNRNNI